MQADRVTKPLGTKAYGSICHLPGSRLGPGDHKLEPGMERILCEKARDRHDVIIVQEKLDGSNVAVAKIDGQLHPLGRSGYPAISSKYEQHRLFHLWVMQNTARFDWLKDGERLCGEWLAQAHGTRYQLWHEPFIPFDLMRGEERAPFSEFVSRVCRGGFTLPRILWIGGPIRVSEVEALLGVNGHHGAVDAAEGAVWRVERKGKVDFLGKYVRPDKVDGKYLPEISGKEPVWNWRP
jgi:hypothetical protein